MNPSKEKILAPFWVRCPTILNGCSTLTSTGFKKAVGFTFSTSLRFDFWNVYSSFNDNPFLHSMSSSAFDVDDDAKLPKKRSVEEIYDYGQFF
jgi:hypothetical protein